MDKTIMGTPIATPMKVPDWNQNDERKADYIKNRTHYLIERIGTRYEHKFLEVTPSTLMQEDSDYTSKLMWMQPGKVYTFKFVAYLNDEVVLSYENNLTARRDAAGRCYVNTNDEMEEFELEIGGHDWSGAPFGLFYEEDERSSTVEAYDFGAPEELEFDKIKVLVSGQFKIINVCAIQKRYLPYIDWIKLDPTVRDKLATKEYVKEYVDENSGSLDGSLSGDVTCDTSEIHYSDNGFEATFNTPLEKGMQLYYDYTANGKPVSGMAKPIKINDSGKLEVSIGDKHHTDFALIGIADDGSDTMTFTFIENVNYSIEVNELSIPTPIPFKLLGISTGLNLGFNTEIKESSLNSNNFGSSNSIDGEHNNTFGTGHTIKGKASTAMGQNGTIEGNLDFLGGDRGNITGRCDFGYGTDVFMSGQNSGAIGYALRSVGDNQFVLGQYNADDAEALLIIGSGEGESSRQNAFVVKKDGNVYINNAKLIKLTQSDKDKIDSFYSSGFDNTTINSNAVVQLGAKNINAVENTVQLGRENNTASAAGGYIYQIGYGNKSLSGQNYLIGKKLYSNEYEQVVVGKFNENVNNAIFVVGNGTADNVRKNAMVIDKYNDVKFSGRVKASAITLVSPGGYEFDVAVRDDGTLHVT